MQFSKSSTENIFSKEAEMVGDTLRWHVDRERGKQNFAAVERKKIKSGRWKTFVDSISSILSCLKNRAQNTNSHIITHSYEGRQTNRNKRQKLIKLSSQWVEGWIKATLVVCWLL